MGDWAATDYETYREIMDELVKPIVGEGLDPETLKSLYESKAVYLENLRVRCFSELNHLKGTHFTWDDYQLILRAMQQTKNHVRQLILLVLRDKLSKRKVS
ncbi:MAG: hypothetical protein ACOH5I_19270 [Oligoflexus sp.]